MDDAKLQLTQAVERYTNARAEADRADHRRNEAVRFTEA